MKSNHLHWRVRVLAVLLFVLALVIVLPPRSAQALQNCSPLPPVPLTEVEQNWIRLQIPVPGVTTTCYEAASDEPGQLKTVYYVQDVASYIAGLYKFIAGAIGIIATLMVFYAGLRWLTAGGNRSRVQDAKETLFSALAAVVLAFGSYLLLYTINPRLVNLRVPTLTPVVPVQLASAYCPTTRTCNSGPVSGAPCTTDADCQVAASGVCGFGVDLGADTTTDCGKTYTYLNSGDFEGNPTTCLGTVCGYGVGADGQVCVAESAKAQPPTSGDAVCIEPKERCESVRWRDTSESACVPLSIPGAGKCTFIDVSWADPLYRDACYWAPKLECPDSTWTRVGCTAACQSECDSDYICNSTAAETVYEYDKNVGDSRYRSICCQKGTETLCVSNPEDD